MVGGIYMHVFLSGTPTTMSPSIRDDDTLFQEYIKCTSGGMMHDEDDEAHSGMTASAREFLKTKFGTISRFYSGIVTADATDANGFARIKTLRSALAALDRGGWERSYHQRIFHVSETSPRVCTGVRWGVAGNCTPVCTCIFKEDIQ